MNCPACQAVNDAAARSCARCGADLLAPTAVTPPPTAVSPVPTTVVVAVDLSPGTIFAGRYEIVRPLGQGGMGMVYLARDRTLDEPTAIKVLRPDFARDPSMAQRFRSEIKLARRVRHRNVAAIHDYGEDGGLLFISMEFIDGVDLKQLLRQRGAFPAAEAYELAIQIAEGLQAVHEAGVIHRDLKTPNIMLDGKGVARLMDFGIAKQHIEGAATTGTGHILGTPEYMSPEQAQGKKVDFRSDIYAMGIVVYELFTGKVPFRGETPIATILKHIQEPPTLEGPNAPALPPSLIPVLRRCLAKDPSGRYDSASELAEALRQARTPLRKQELLSTAVLEAPTLRRPRDRRVPRWGVGLGVGLAVVAGVGIVLRSARPRDTPVTSLPVATESPTPSAAPATAPPTPERTLPPVLVASAGPSPAAPSAVSGAISTRPAATRREPTPTAATATRASAAPPATSPPASSSAPTASPSPAAPAAVETGGEPGWLLVSARPWANVFVDGVSKGSTPLDRFQVAAGRHKVVLQRPGYESHEVNVIIRSGQTETVRFNFETQGQKQ
jgi:eukaryotic-like serine/threonine-protein kinase